MVANVTLNNIVDEPIEVVKMTSKVDHPAHYQGSIECIDYIYSVGMAKGFCLGNAIKYIHRAGNKDGESVRDDLEKARWYLDWYLNHMEAEGDV